MEEQKLVCIIYVKLVEPNSLNFSLDSLHVSTAESRSVKDATEKSNGEEKLVSNIIECLSCNS